MAYVFDVPAYFILLRETLEVTIILAVLLGFVDNLALGSESLRMKFKKQIWIGTFAGLIVSLLIGATFIIVFYSIKKNLWEESESAWEGAFSLIASVVITIMSLSMVQAQKWKSKWENKLKSATEQYLKKHEEGNRWALILLPFSVVLREGVETIVFIAGIGFQKPATGLPIPVITGLLSGVFIGYLIYKGSHKLSLKLFFGFTTTLLLFIAAGLFSNSIHELQDATGTYEHVVWELKCCNKGQFWGLMKNLFGWRNKATVGTTVGYFVYWFVIGLSILYLIYKEKKKTLVLKGEIIDKEDGEKDVEKGEKDVEIDVEKDEKDVEKDVENVVVEKDVEKVVEKDVENVVVEKDVENVVVEKDGENVVVEKDVEKVVESDEKVVVEKDVENVVVEKDNEKVVVEKDAENVVVEKDVENVVEKDAENVVVEKDVEKVVEKDEKVVEKDVEKAVEKDEKVVEKDESKV